MLFIAGLVVATTWAIGMTGLVVYTGYKLRQVAKSNNQIPATVLAQGFAQS